LRYRILGRTGFKVSEFGLGGHEYARFPSPYHFQSSREPGEELNREELLKNQEERNKLIRKAIDSGINYFDTTLVEEAQSLGLALQELGKRDEVIIAAETIHPLKNLDNTPRNRWEDLVSGGVEARLRQLKTDQIDVYNLHMPEVGYSPEKFSVAIQTLETLRDEGKIVSIGASSHDPRFLAELIRIYDSFDAVTVRYNYHLQKAREFLFPLCKALVHTGSDQLQMDSRLPRGKHDNYRDLLYKRIGRTHRDLQ
jgi:aryl-alcohol dehydrogenase-like predicted oxidoreductase